jgi:hypothetical protein
LAASAPRARGQSPDAGFDSSLDTDVVPVHVPQGPAAMNISGRKSIYARQ